MDEITDLLSEKRLAKYKGIGKENAIACHLFNCELAESFYSSLSYFEIILRNKIPCRKQHLLTVVRYFVQS